MTDAEITRLALALLVQAPFSFRMGYVVRDGRELACGCLFLGVGSGLAGLGAAGSGSVLVGIGAALAGALFLAQARLTAARRASAPPSSALTPPLSPVSPPPAAAPVPPGMPAVTAPAAGSSIFAGLAFLAQLLEAADRIGELRHRWRLRKLQSRQAAGPGREQLVRYLRARAKRDPLWPPRP